MSASDTPGFDLYCAIQTVIRYAVLGGFQPTPDMSDLDWERLKRAAGELEQIDIRRWSHVISPSEPQ